MKLFFYLIQGIDMETVHLIGTGAGVPLIYYVGKAIQRQNIANPGRITAIDAGPGFEYPEWTKDFKTLSNYTEAIHTSISYRGDNRPGRYVCFPHIDFLNGGYNQNQFFTYILIKSFRSFDPSKLDLDIDICSMCCKYE